MGHIACGIYPDILITVKPLDESISVAVTVVSGETVAPFIKVAKLSLP